MTKKKDVVFISPEQAQDHREKLDLDMLVLQNHIKIAWIITAISVALNFFIFTTQSASIGSFSWYVNNLSLLALVTVIPIASIVLYIKSIGFGTAFSFAKKIAFVGWFLLPFPIDIFTGIFTFAIGIAFFLFFPALFFRSARKNMKKEIADIEEYLKYSSVQ